MKNKLQQDILDLSYLISDTSLCAIESRYCVPIKVGTLLKLFSLFCQFSGAPISRLSYEIFLKKINFTVDDMLFFNLENTAKKFLSVYKKKQYDYIIIGPPSGAITYIASLFEIPFLPLNFAITVRRKKKDDPDNVISYFEHALMLSEEFFLKDPNLIAGIVYDPIHQRLETKNFVSFRIHFKELLGAYKDFISTSLAKDGKIIFIESRVGWRQYKPSDRVFFQVGSFGGIPDDEMIRGSKRLEVFRLKYGKEGHIMYRIKASDEVLPELQFGTQVSLKDSLLEYSKTARFSLQHILINDIFLLSKLAADIFIRTARKEGKRPSRLFVHSGCFINPSFCLETSALPLWLPDGSFHSFQFVETFINTYPFPIEEVVLSLMPSISGAPDIIQLQRWQSFFSERKIKVILAGMSHKFYPLDIVSLHKFWDDCKRLGRRYKDSLDVRLSKDEFINTINQINIT